ncbi:unnamed protein product [Mesocestoides corti]|uniref:Uncharacterized protein n=1 Tax=Mesocestoides corti TaxID=53468 RepID=A0A0R3U591_MESCO|nr:unnamed protein product [Mesocestoides corti]
MESRFALHTAVKKITAINSTSTQKPPSQRLQSTVNQIAQQIGNAKFHESPLRACKPPSAYTNHNGATDTSSTQGRFFSALPASDAESYDKAISQPYTDMTATAAPPRSQLVPVHCPAAGFFRHLNRSRPFSQPISLLSLNLFFVLASIDRSDLYTCSFLTETPTRFTNRLANAQCARQPHALRAEVHLIPLAFSAFLAKCF